MTGLTVPAGEHGQVRLFAVDATGSELDRFVKQAAFSDGQPSEFLNVAFGVEELDPAHVDLIDTSDLVEIGLEGYLTQGLGIAPESLAGDLSAIQALTGKAVVLRSAAFGGRAENLTPLRPLRFVGHWPEQTAVPPQFQPLPAESAVGEIPPAPASAPMQAGQGAVALIAVLAVILAIFLIVFGIPGGGN